MQIDRLTMDDIPGALRLSTQAGWNQLDADWRRLLDLWPDLCLGGKIDGHVVATATLARYGNAAWVGMVLVDERHRGQGLGGAIMNAILTRAETAGVKVLGLDATDMGKPVYAKRGFVDAASINRRVLAAEDRGPCKSPLERVNDADWASMLELDLASCGWDRSALLRHLCRERGARCEVAREGGEVIAFGFRRPGRTAEHIGPVVGTSAGVQSVILSLAAPSGEMPVMMDTFSGGKIDAWLGDVGFDVKRKLTRMWRGKPTASKNVYAAAGFELG